MRRIGILLPGAANDPEFQARVAAFHQGLALSCNSAMTGGGSDAIRPI
jgi:hypothetical protein